MVDLSDLKGLESVQIHDFKLQKVISGDVKWHKMSLKCNFRLSLEYN